MPEESAIETNPNLYIPKASRRPDIHQNKILRLRERQKVLEKEARIDELTKLPNLRGFNEELERRIKIANRTGRPLIVWNGDIDDFGKFNKQYGHKGGDLALQLIKDLPARTEEPISRIGGEEFGQFLDEEIDVENLAAVFSRYRERMSEMSKALFEKASTIKPVDPQDKMNQVTLSFGVTQYIPCESKEEFLRRANLALHEAKNTGKNKACMANIKDGKIEFQDLEMKEQS